MSEAGPATGSETDFVLHDWWSPLERHKSSGIFLSHLANTGAGIVTGSGHGLGGQTFGGWGADDYSPKGPTIDQIIAGRLEEEGRGGFRPSVVWGSAGQSEAGGTGDAFVSEAGPTIRPTTNPRTAWNEVFSGFSPPDTDPSGQERAAFLLAQKKSVLDFAASDCEKLRDALGAEGMRLFEEHCSTVRSLERGLETTLVDGGMCEQPADPGDGDWTKPNNIDDQTGTFFDLMSMTLACELSHVVSFQFQSRIY
jgi:hypothetical protein